MNEKTSAGHSRGRPKGSSNLFKNKGQLKIRKESVSALPVVRQFVDIVREIDTPIPELMSKVGSHYRTYENWRRGYNSPNMREFEAAANVLGYTLKLVPLDPEKEEINDS